MRRNLWLATLAVLLASPAFAQAPTGTQSKAGVVDPGQAGAPSTTVPPAAVPQTKGGQVMSQSPSGATSSLPTDKGTGSSNKQ